MSKKKKRKKRKPDLVDYENLSDKDLSFLLSRLERLSPVEAHLHKALQSHSITPKQRLTLLGTLFLRRNERKKSTKPFTRSQKKWKKKREKALVRAGNQCEICTSSFHLFVQSDLQVLCEDCHRMAHEEKSGIPRDSLTEEYHSILG